MENHHKEIHFYKDCILPDYIETNDVLECFEYTHNSTVKAIEEDKPFIHTFAISALDFAWLLDKNYEIVLHENGKFAVCHEGRTVLTDKDLRKGHNIAKIWIGGGFNGYFYKREKIDDLVGYFNYD